MKNRNPVIVNLPSSRGWKKAERVVEDVAPTKYVSGASPKTSQQQQQQQQQQHSDSSSDTSLKENLCLVCLENKARYTCPKCQMPFCSTECYRQHTNIDSSTTTSGNHPPPCSEDFFKRKVFSLMQLESSEQQENSHRALNRYHHQSSNEQNFQEYLNDDDNDTVNLYELQLQLDLLENENKELPYKELVKLLSPSVRAMFENDLKTGKLQAESILNRWHPWWKRELVMIRKESNDNDSVLNDSKGSQTENDDAFSITLDERLLKIPDVERKGKSQPSKNENNDILMCNLIDILYATCRTLRLYHGVENASRQAPVEAAINLISTSSVIGKDLRFHTTSQVLNYHYTSTASNNKSINQLGNETEKATNRNDFDNWGVYMEDIASFITSPRMVGRALLEATDILKAAIKELKHNQTNSNNTKESNDDGATKLKQIRRLRKKLQFYLSWAVRNQVAANLMRKGEPKEEILAWIDEQKQLFVEYEGNDE